MKFKEYITSKKFIIVLVVLILMWSSLMIFYYLKADEITRDPCSICAERMGKNVQCRTIPNEGDISRERIYYLNGTIYNTPLIIDDNLLSGMEYDKFFKDYNKSVGEGES